MRLCSEYRADPVAFWLKLAPLCNFHVAGLAEICGISVRQLERIIEADLGQSPRSWLHEQRMISARRLLLEVESVKKVALDLGYKHPQHFSRDFKLWCSLTPSEYLEKMAVV